jgi:hypothetical protein
LIFLNWYSVIEPEHFTGIRELDVTFIFESYKSLNNNYIVENKLDVEFIWMLKHYSYWEYAISDYPNDKLIELTSFVKAADTLEINFPKHSLPKGIMNNRGQMGIYWKELVEVK